MKIIINFILLLLFCSSLFGQVNWTIDEDSANVALLVLNYNDYIFEGGAIESYQYYSGYDDNGLPFSIEFNPPLDYGNILFAYEPSGDTIFYADIWWMGQGEIIYPESFISSDQFDWDPDICDDPVSIEYFDYMGEISNEEFQVKADSAWYNIQKLSVIKEFAQYPYRVGIYLYAPSVGMFNPNVAKWIIFLYVGKISTDVTNLSLPESVQLHQNYPNPFNPETTIKFSLKDASQIKLEIFNTKGEMVEVIYNDHLSAGDHQFDWNADKYTSGVYFYRLITDKKILTRKMILLK